MATTIITDSLLIAKYQQGDEDALSELIRRNKKELYSFIFYKIMDEELANDLFQDTFVKIIISLKEGRYNDDGKFILWAKRIAHNLIIDHFRLKNKYVKISETTYENDEFSIFDLLRETEENIEDSFPIPARYVGKGNYFMLMVKGDSMIEAGIFDGDYILVKQQQTANNGEIVVAMVDGFESEATVKTYYREKGHIRLQPENENMSPIIVKDVKILGLVKGVFRYLS